MGISAFGTLIKKGDAASPEVFTTIAEVVEIGGPGLELDMIEITNHSSSGGVEEFVGGILRVGEVSLDINYDPAGATHDASTGLIKDMNDRTLRNFQLIFPDVGTTTASFAAFVQKFEPGAAVDDKLSASVTLKLSGPVTWA